MQKIIPHLWFDTQAKEAAMWYTSIFPDAHIDDTLVLHNTPSGDCDVVNFTLAGYQFASISAGPLFTFTPAISFFVACSSAAEVDGLWAKLSEGGTALMELGSYPFSERYGWIQDRYGVSWQLMHMGERPITQRIVPSFLFVGAVCGKAEEAMQHYTGTFPNSSVNFVLRYAAGEAPDAAGTIKHAGFMLAGQQFAAMDSAHEHKFTFNEAISLIVNCDTQEEIDHYWAALSAVPEAEQCGWLKDRYGVSWQIVPRMMNEIFKENDPAKIARITAAFLQMKKFDLAALDAAARG